MRLQTELYRDFHGLADHAAALEIRCLAISTSFFTLEALLLSPAPSSWSVLATPLNRYPCHLS